MSLFRLFLLATSGIVLGLTVVGDSGCGSGAGSESGAVATGNPCTDDDDCVSDSRIGEICVECVVGSNCSTNICDTGRCVDCLTDSDCSAGEACAEDGSCATTSCSGDSDCPEGQVCTVTFSEESEANLCVDSVSCNFDAGTGCSNGLTCQVDNVCR